MLPTFCFFLYFYLPLRTVCRLQLINIHILFEAFLLFSLFDLLLWELCCYLDFHIIPNNCVCYILTRTAKMENNKCWWECCTTVTTILQLLFSNIYYNWTYVQSMNQQFYSLVGIQQKWKNVFTKRYVLECW